MLQDKETLFLLPRKNMPKSWLENSIRLISLLYFLFNFAWQVINYLLIFKFYFFRWLMVSICRHRWSNWWSTENSCRRRQGILTSKMDLRFGRIKFESQRCFDLGWKRSSVLCQGLDRSLAFSTGTYVSMTSLLEHSVAQPKTNWCTEIVFY